MQRSTKMDIKKKLTSRKLWAAIAGIIVGLVVAFGGEQETIQTVAGSVMSVVSAIVYIIAEAGVDKAGAGADVYKGAELQEIDAVTTEEAKTDGDET